MQITRKDGRTQGYWVKNENVKNYNYKVKGKGFLPRKRQPPIPLTMWRVTAGINYVNRKEYYSFVKQSWFLTETRARLQEDFIKIDVVKGLEKHLGYAQSEWWFTDTPSSAVEEVPFDRSLIGRSRMDSEYVGGNK